MRKPRIIAETLRFIRSPERRNRVVLALGGLGLTLGLMGGLASATESLKAYGMESTINNEEERTLRQAKRVAERTEYAQKRQADIQQGRLPDPEPTYIGEERPARPIEPLRIEQANASEAGTAFGITSIFVLGTALPLTLHAMRRDRKYRLAEEGHTDDTSDPYADSPYKTPFSAPREDGYFITPNCVFEQRAQRARLRTALLYELMERDMVPLPDVTQPYNPDYLTVRLDDLLDGHPEGQLVGAGSSA